jgi:hypothetical protein
VSTMVKASACSSSTTDARQGGGGGGCSPRLAAARMKEVDISGFDAMVFAEMG